VIGERLLPICVLRELAHVSKARDVGHPVFSFCFFHVSLWGSCRSQTEQVPGFAVFLEAGAAGSLCAIGINEDLGAICELEEGDDVPDIVRNDVGSDEIDFSRGILNNRPASAVNCNDAVSRASGGEN
jgi:hypothetical protein